MDGLNWFLRFFLTSLNNFASNYLWYKIHTHHILEKYDFFLRTFLGKSSMWPNKKVPCGINIFYLFV